MKIKTKKSKYKEYGFICKDFHITVKARNEREAYKEYMKEISALEKEQSKEIFSEI